MSFESTCACSSKLKFSHLVTKISERLSIKALSGPSSTLLEVQSVQHHLLNITPTYSLDHKPLTKLTLVSINSFDITIFYHQYQVFIFPYTTKPPFA